MTIMTVFIDRDGTVGGDGHYTPVADFKPYPGSAQAITKLKDAGIRVLALTNQSHIEVGEMNENNLRQSLISLGFTDAFICPHGEKSGCSCRKPQTELIASARAKYGFSLTEAVIIGDSYRADMQCALNANMLGIHVATGRGSAGRAEVAGTFVETCDLAAAADWILRHQFEDNHQ